MAVNPSPFGPKPQFEIAAGTPAVGNKLFFYVAGSVGTKQNTYTSSTGLAANTNPVILDALGMPTNCELWFTAGVSYKVVYAPSTDTDPPTSPIWTVDNLLGINDVTGAVDEWKAGPTPTFVSATQFTLVGDQTTNFAVGRRVKATVTAGTVYGTITVSAFAAVTTVTVVLDSGNLDSGLSAISYGILSATNSSIPNLKLVAGIWTFQNAVNEAQGANIASAATVNLDTATGNYVHVTGAVGVTAITLSQGRERTVVWDSTVALTNGASLILRNGISRTTVANETSIFRGEAAGVVREIGPGATKQQTRQVLITGTAATYTTPAGATRINIRMVGGGGGGAGNGSGGNGTASTWSGGSLSAGLGTGGVLGSAGGAGGASSNGDINLSGGSGSGVPSIGGGRFDNGGCGGNSALGGGGGGGASSAGPTAGLAGATNSGGGGGGGACVAVGTAGSGGGAGGYCEKLILAPAATYTYTVGASGTAGTSNANTAAGGAGGSGIIIVDEYYN